MRRPTMRLAYCTGTRRWACSTNTTATTTAIPRASTTRNVAQPRSCWMLHKAAGKLATTDVKISTDMPLPTPRSVMSSPSHMTTPVPAVITRIINVMVQTVSFGMSCSGHPGKRLPVRARVTKLADCSSASPIVR